MTVIPRSRTRHGTTRYFTRRTPMHYVTLTDVIIESRHRMLYVTELYKYVISAHAPILSDRGCTLPRTMRGDNENVSAFERKASATRLRCSFTGEPLPHAVLRQPLATPSRCLHEPALARSRGRTAPPPASRSTRCFEYMYVRNSRRRSTERSILRISGSS